MSNIINEVLEKIGKEKAYITINQDKRKKIVEEARIICGTYKNLRNRIGICESSIFKMKRSTTIAMSSNTLLKILDLSNSRIQKKDIIEVRSRPSG